MSTDMATGKCTVAIDGLSQKEVLVLNSETLPNLQGISV